MVTGDEQRRGGFHHFIQGAFLGNGDGVQSGRQVQGKLSLELTGGVDHEVAGQDLTSEQHRQRSAPGVPTKAGALDQKVSLVSGELQNWPSQGGRLLGRSWGGLRWHEGKEFLFAG